MNMGLEASMDILESAWSAWIQTYWIQKSLVPASIQQNPGIALKQGQLKCLLGKWAAEIWLLL